MVVVDTTVLGDAIVGDAAMEESARKLVLEDPFWISVGLWRYEFGNILRQHHRVLGAELDQLKVGLLEVETFLMETVEEIDTAAILDVAARRDLTFYDSSFVWLALDRGLSLRTRDKEVLRKCPDVALAMPEP